MRITLTKAIATGTVCVLTLTACAPGADPDSVISEPWNFGGAVPAGLAVPIPSDGKVVNSLETVERTTVMVSYPEARLLELVAFYDDEIDGSGAIRSEHTIELQEWGTAWMVRWSAEGSEVRVGQCIDPFARTLTLVCVVIDQDA